MTAEFKLPDLGEGIHEAEIIAVRVKVGEFVKEDQVIFEVETDKAVVEIPSPYSGAVQEIKVKTGEIVTVGSVMITFGDVSAQDTQEKSTAKTVVSEISSRSLSDSASRIEVKGQATLPLQEVGIVPAAPATRRLARELGIDLHSIIPTGKGGRVLTEDVKAYAQRKPNGGGQPGATFVKSQTVPTGSIADQVRASLVSPALPDFSHYGAVERIPLRSVRRKIALNMSLSWAHIPHVCHSDEADVTQLLTAIAKKEKDFAQAGGKLTLMVFVLKAVVNALKKYPQFNASVDEVKEELIYKHFYNLGVAVATEKGLIVPVLKDVDRKSIKELSIELKDLAQKTRCGHVDLESLHGGTFTITNIGAIGGTGMSPIINYPEVAILGMARAKEQPVVRNSQVTIATILPLTLAFDHRIADGAEAAYFVGHIISQLEAPATFTTEV